MNQDNLKPADEEGRVSVSVTMSENGFAKLDRLARSSGQELGDVIGKAFLLYEAAVEARKEGKAVGIAPNADVLETEFVGL